MVPSSLEMSVLPVTFESSMPSPALPWMKPPSLSMSTEVTESMSMPLVAPMIELGLSLVMVTASASMMLMAARWCR